MVRPLHRNNVLIVKPYLGPQHQSQLIPGIDGSIQPELSCNYCKDTRYNKTTERMLQCKEAMKVASGQSTNSISLGKYWS